ncbi:3-dehydroquinate synthase [Selenomonas ruminantium]|uniref:3-dehydroquinate synthase n=1 Tax=Selenomonas ruminantium TaxID=971 RepID=A0A1M6WHD8_SELRU|nr:3-dehydroquinate synthase [Selenomonas ruminantium]SHK93170.1 3-dehydroquinate synthase [Selenomonas ruminantium]
MRKVRVDLGSDSYDIVIGYNIEQEIIDFIQQKDYSAKGLLVTDTNVGPLYSRKMQDILTQAGLDIAVVQIKAGEQSKTLEVANEAFTKAIEWGLDRKSPVFALGGGVVGDLAGFVAATYMRGVPFVQIPTSLLAQVDSSVGGKVAVNHELGKNLIGAFYQPQAVFMDLDCMQTLPKREIYTGLGEIIKYGIIYDAEFFAFLEEHQADVLSLEPEKLTHMIARSCEIKAAVVSQDEKEAGLRRILNFGHTIGHAIEKETAYIRYNHGEAVATGMVGAAYISKALGLIDEAAYGRVKELVAAYNLPLQAAGVTVDAMYADIFHDKKTIGGKVNWVLMESIGGVCCKNDVPEEIVKQAMQAISV